MTQKELIDRVASETGGDKGRRYKDVKQTNVKVKTEKEQREIERKLKETGYRKIADCMWVVIYRKKSNEVIIERDY